MLFVIIEDTVEKHLFFDFIIDYDTPFTIIISKDNAMSNIVGVINNEEFFFVIMR